MEIQCDLSSSHKRQHTIPRQEKPGRRKSIFHTTGILPGDGTEA